jgi:hypothetical protein
MNGLVGISDYFILKRLIFRGNVSAFLVTLLETVGLRFKENSRKSFSRGLRERLRALINVLRPLPTCFAHVERLGNTVSLHGKNSRRKCAMQSACAVEIHQIRRSYRSGRPLIDVLPDLGDHNGAFAHGRGYSFDRPRPYVADGENSGVGCSERRSR